MITMIGLDADDTLWQNESYFRLTQDHFTNLLRDYADPDHLHERLLAAERRNLGAYGFGVKGFTLSMIETAIEITDGRVPASVISELLGAGRSMLEHPVELLPGTLEAVRHLADSFKLVVITKGDLLDQERKIAQSGLGDYFQAVEIVSDKTPAVYSHIFARHGTGADHALMAGNSMKSDVLPAIQAGGHGVYIPHGLIWALEAAEPPQNQPRYHTLPEIAALPPLLKRLTNP